MRTCSLALAVAVFCPIVTAFSLALDGRAQAAAPGEEPTPFVLTTSGGISLGSYEAGVNWALIEAMKRRSRGGPAGYSDPALVAVTGASAGSINGVLSALQWCTDPATAGALLGGSVKSNLMKDTWVGIGIDELLPSDDGAYYAAGPGLGKNTPDALFSRQRAFAPAVDRVRELLRAPVFRAGCRIPIGLLVTRERASEQVTDSVRVSNQRFVIALEFVADADGWGRFRSAGIKNDDDADLGSVVYVAGWGEDAEGGVSLDVDDVVRLLYASSAYPVAFSKVDLEYCTSREGGRETYRCPDGTYLRQANFLDGGIFDNIPLGAARVLAEPAPGKDEREWAAGGRRHWFFFIDPGNRRGVPAESAYPTQERTVTYGLMGMTSFLPGVLKTLGDYELYTLLRSGKWSSQAHAFRLRLDDVAAPLSEDDDSAPGPRRPQIRAAGGLTAAIDDALASGPGYCASLSEDEALAFARGVDRLLERNYLPFGLQGGGNRLSGTELAERRRILLHCLAGLARRFKEPGLVHAIDQAVLDRYGDRKVVVSSRHFAVTGAYLGHFGAFLDRPFREFDYYAGVYDGVHDLAAFVCQGRRDDRGACIGEQAREIAVELGVDRSEDARTVFALLASHEHPDYAQPHSPWRWVNDELAMPRAARLELVYRALWDATRGARASDDSDAMFRRFVRNLRDGGYEAESSVMRRIIARCDEVPTSWYAPTVAELGRRLQVLQKAEVRAGGTPAGWRYAAAGLSLGFGKSFDPRERFTLGPSSEAPGDRRWKLVPYEIAADVHNRGVSIAYQPQLRAGRLSLDLKVTPLGFSKLHDDWSGFSQLDLYASMQAPWVLVSAMGIGPTVGYLWEPVDGYDRVNVGVAAYVEGVRTIRMTVGLRSLDDAGIGGNIYVLLGLTDLPGLLSRLSRL